MFKSNLIIEIVYYKWSKREPACRGWGRGDAKFSCRTFL